MLDICTDITGRKDLYEQNGLAVQAVEAIRLNAEHRLGRAPYRCCALLRRHQGKGQQRHHSRRMLADLGCVNIADSDASLLETLSAESVIGEPYRIFVVTMGDDAERYEQPSADDGREPGGERRTRSRRRLHLMDRRLFNIKPNARWAESY